MLRVSDSAIVEGNAGSSIIEFKVALDIRNTDELSVQYQTADGTAVAPDDYLPKSGSLTFPAGSGPTTQVVQVMVHGDTSLEGDETFSVNLTDPEGNSIFDPRGVGTIVNDDSAPPAAPPAVSSPSRTSPSPSSRLSPGPRPALTPVIRATETPMPAAQPEISATPQSQSPTSATSPTASTGSDNSTVLWLVVAAVILLSGGGTWALLHFVRGRRPH